MAAMPKSCRATFGKSRLVNFFSFRMVRCNDHSASEISNQNFAQHDFDFAVEQPVRAATESPAANIPEVWINWRRFIPRGLAENETRSTWFSPEVREHVTSPLKNPVALEKPFWAQPANPVFARNHQTFAQSKHEKSRQALRNRRHFLVIHQWQQCRQLAVVSG